MKENQKILDERVSLYNKKQGVRVGDYLRLPNGKYTRFTYDWNRGKERKERIQTGGSKYGGFYLGEGSISYSGSLDSGVKKSDVVPTKRKMEGAVWFFDKDMWGAGRGKEFLVPFRVFKLKKGADTSGLNMSDKLKKVI